MIDLDTGLSVVRVADFGWILVHLEAWVVDARSLVLSCWGSVVCAVWGGGLRVRISGRFERL